MPSRLINVHLRKTRLEEITKLRDEVAVMDSWTWSDGEESANVAFIAHAEDVEAITDKLQSVLKEDEGQSITVSGLDTVLPLDLVERTEEQQKKSKTHRTRISREELYENVVASSQISWTFFLLTLLSTIVASIGLLEDDVAVVIGAMVIAPLLGPNIALALATALGDRKLMTQSLKANVLGVGLSILLAVGVGYIWPGSFESDELLSRTRVSYDNIALAIAAGAAAALSLTTGVSSVLVGVMVAVALLPPAATVGLMIGNQDYYAANGALLLLVINIACINFSAKVVFWVQKIRPRQWYSQKGAKEAMRNYLLFWGATLIILAMFIYWRKSDLDLLAMAL